MCYCSELPSSNRGTIVNAASRVAGGPFSLDYRQIMTVVTPTNNAPVYTTVGPISLGATKPDQLANFTLTPNFGLGISDPDGGCEYRNPALFLTSFLFLLNRYTGSSN